ncbi:purine-binding chemotaxis protein CheW [Vibrio sp. RE86]|uniref:chemotaxis protein CheW n=1 Tax=Vibrio sp. RE86 TaxID=2607605 RepID=UPI00149356E3|nr:chemotaxis protein CheW [Vibrio sp. RE86]NOH78138.1 purine-binding chemotaxis protein CheW [Vibrio sp. RE86]
MIATQEFLSFVVEGEEYGVPILDVREVRGWNPVREVPNSPSFMKGVLEIRGEYVPIVDLRMRFGLSAAVIGSTTVVIVLNDAQKHPLGIIVDGVSEVYPLSEEQIKPSPYVANDVDHHYVRGIASVTNGHLILLNLDALFDTAQLALPNQEEESWA